MSALRFQTPTGMATLHPRQIDVLKAASRGLGVKATAAVLRLSAETVKGHRAAICKAVKAGNMTQAAVIAAKAGVL